MPSITTGNFWGSLDVPAINIFLMEWYAIVVVVAAVVVAIAGYIAECAGSDPFAVVCCGDAVVDVDST